MCQYHGRLQTLIVPRQEVDDWLEEYRTKFTEMSGMKKLTEASEGASC